MSSNSVALDEILSEASNVARDVIAKNAESVDSEGIWPEEGLRALQKVGLGGLTVPREYGGHGQGLLALAKVCEVLGRECTSTSLCFGMHCVAAAVISVKTTNAQQAYLKAIARGEHLTTLALSEPGTGSHFYFPETQLTEEDGGFLVSGTKHFITNGGQADSYVVSTVAPGQEASALGEFSCVIVRREAEGIEWGESWSGLGMRGNSSRTMTLQNVKVPREDFLGEEGDEIWYTFNVVAPYFLMAMAGTYLGLASAAFEEARTHMKRRKLNPSGLKLAQIPLLQHRLGSLWQTIERTRQLIYFAGAEADAGSETALLALCSAKADVADCAVEVVNQAMTLTGGLGYRDNGKLGRLLRDARAAHVMSPTTDLLLTWVGRILLDEPLLGD